MSRVGFGVVTATVAADVVAVATAVVAAEANVDDEDDCLHSECIEARDAVVVTTTAAADAVATAVAVIIATRVAAAFAAAVDAAIAAGAAAAAMLQAEGEQDFVEGDVANKDEGIFCTCTEARVVGVVTA